jgi:hypothetical protein
MNLNAIFELITDQFITKCQPPCKFSDAWVFESDPDDDYVEPELPDPLTLETLTQWSDRIMNLANCHRRHDFQLKQLTANIKLYTDTYDFEYVISLTRVFGSHPHWTVSSVLDPEGKYFFCSITFSP